jgi:uncharacterized membrane protein
MTHVDYNPGAIDAGGCVSNGWEMVKMRYGMYLGISLLTLVFIGCIPFLNYFLMGPVLGGVYYIFLRDMRGEPVEFGMMFEGFKKFVPLMLVGLIQSIPAIVYTIFSFGLNIAQSLQGSRGGYDPEFFQSSAPDLASTGFLAIGLIVGLVILALWIAWAIAFYFAIPLMMERDLSVTDAIKLSARAGFSNGGGIILLAILLGLLSLLGAIMCVVGIFLISVPVTFAAYAIAYRQVFPYVGGNALNTTPPPPGAYGSSFGQGF